MNEKITIRRFAETDAETVQNIIHRGLREINGKDYPAELMEEYCNYFTLEKIRQILHICMLRYLGMKLSVRVQ